jgi:putative phosphoribosyl transferase
MFANRREAGIALSKQVYEYLREHLLGPAQSQAGLAGSRLVVGLPRGGVPVAAEVAKIIGSPLDILVSKKLPFPTEPEYAIGAVSSDGIVVLSAEIPKTRQWQEYVDLRSRELSDWTRAREAELYNLAGFSATCCRGKVVIVVDDGIATGWTALAAVKSLLARGARSVVVAAPVVSKESIALLEPFCERILALLVPDTLISIGRYFEHFESTDDQEVVRLLREARAATELSATRLAG